MMYPLDQNASEARDFSRKVYKTRSTSFLAWKRSKRIVAALARPSQPPLFRKRVVTGADIIRTLTLIRSS